MRAAACVMGNFRAQLALFQLPAATLNTGSTSGSSTIKGVLHIKPMTLTSQKRYEEKLSKT